MVPKGYEEVSEGVYESDAFTASRPTIDSARIRQILNDQLASTVSSASRVLHRKAETAAQETK
jgi:hypothetical protein